MLTAMAGGINAAPGDVLDLEPRVATAWVAAHIAEPAGDGEAPEAAAAETPDTAAVAPPEHATRPRPKPRKAKGR